MRLNQIDRVKIGKYLAYATGEIILIAIGILIAFQVNQRAEIRKDKAKERVLLKELNREFRINASLFQSNIEGHDRIFDACSKISALFPIKSFDISPDSLASWGATSLNWNTFNPYQGTIKSIINTSSFEVISNDTLRSLLIGWQDMLADYQEEERYSLEFLQNIYKPYVMKHASLNTLKDPRIDFSFLQTLEFENMIIERKALEYFDNTVKDDRVEHAINEIIRLSDLKS